MNVEIHFRPTDGPPQTLYANMSREEFNEINRIIASGDAGVFVIPARTKRDGPTHRWTFRADLITLLEA